MPAFDPHAEDTVAVLAPPSTKRRPRRPRPERVPPSEPPDFFGGWGGDGPGDDGAGHGHDPAQPDDLARFGLLLAMIGSSVMFGVFVAVYLLLVRGEGTSSAPLPLSTWLATALLFGSSVTLHGATRAARRGALETARRRVGATVALGSLFLGAQVHLWTHLASGGWVPQRGPGVAMFWALTALHAGHVLLGLGTLVRILRRGELTSRPPEAPPLLALGATFWHFLGVLWALLFVVLFAAP